MPSLIDRSSLRRNRSQQSHSTRGRFARVIEPLEHRLVFAAVQDWSIRGVGGGGALFSPGFNPTNTSEMYIASDMGQLFRTTNEGALWETVDHSELHGGHNSEVQFTTDPLIRYSLSYGDSGGYGSPTKSTDGGITWTPMAADPTGGEVYTIVVDYNNPNRVLIASYSRLYVSNNGGTSFAQRFVAPDEGAGLHIGGAFFDGNNIFVGTSQGVIVSTNGGTSNFTLAGYVVPNNEQILSFAGAKSGAITRLWAVTGPEGAVYPDIQGYDFDYAGVYRIDVGQASWTSISSGLPVSAKPFAVAAAMNDVNNVYLGGGDTSIAHPRVYRSTVGGGSWQSVLLTSNNANVQTGWSGTGGVRDWSYGEFALGLAVAPLDSSRILITDLGFAHYSEDSGGSWRSLNVAPDDLNPAGAPIPAGQTYKSSGLENTTSWNLTWTSSSHMIGSFSDIRGAVSHDSGTSWSFNYTGHTQNSMYRSIVHPTTVVYAATSTVHDMYQSTYLTDARIDGGDGNVLFSTNGGDTWQVMHDLNRVVVWVEADPTNPNRLYAAVSHSTDGGIYVTNNATAGAASTWTKLANPPRTQGHAFNIRVLADGTLVASYSGRRDSGGAFTASSGVFVSTNGGTSWQDRSHSGMLYWTKDVVIDPHDATQNTWYATVFSGWGGAPNGLGGVYRTTNRGQSWTRINSLDRVNSITISPTNPNEAYITTETEGLWYTENLLSLT